MPDPRWLPVAALAALVVSILIPAGFAAAIEARHATHPEAVVDGVTYTSFVLVEPVGPVQRPEAMRLLLVDALTGIIAEDTVPRIADRTGGVPGAREALDVVERALGDMGPANPVVRPTLVARRGEEPGSVVVEVRDARVRIAEPAIGESDLGLDVVFDAEGRATAVFITDGGRLVGAPVEMLPAWVPVVR